jgi:hypothetical protein
MNEDKQMGGAPRGSRPSSRRDSGRDDGHHELGSYATVRDQRREYLETTEGLHGGPCFKEDFQGNWSNVKYSRYMAADQDTYDWILRDQGADRLIESAIQPGVATPARDAWAQTRALVQGVAEIATKLSTAGFHYKARNRSRAWKLWAMAGIPRTSRASRMTRSTP